MRAKDSLFNYLLKMNLKTTLKLIIDFCVVINFFSPSLLLGRMSGRMVSKFGLCLRYYLQKNPTNVFCLAHKYLE